MIEGTIYGRVWYKGMMMPQTRTMTSTPNIKLHTKCHGIGIVML